MIVDSLNSSREEGRSVSIESVVETEESDDEDVSSSRAAVRGNGDGRGPGFGRSFILGSARNMSDMVDY